MSGIKKFTFDALGNVTAMYEVKGTRMKLESSYGTTFEAHTGTFTSGQQGVVEVAAVRLGRGKTETTVYSDGDGDGRFVESFELDVVNVSPYRTENYKFDLAGETVVTAYEQGKRGWKVDRVDSNEDYSVVTAGSDTFVVKTESEYRGVDFEVYVDRDGDGLWTKIADGKTSGAYLNADGSVDLVGIAGDGLLAPADVVLV